MRKLLIVLTGILVLQIGANSQDTEKVIERFSADSQQGDKIIDWEEKSFVGNTRYSIVHEDDNFVLHAQADRAASGLYKEIKYDLHEYPHLSWRWKVTKLPEKGDVYNKETDDYGARVYVIFPRFLKWKTKTINYIWAKNLPKGESHPNSWLPDNAIMIAAQSGTENLGQWMTETHNVYEDYQKLFHEKPPRVGAIALMSDSDNTGGFAEAYYDDFVISKK